jgi:hypothetical protein
VDHSEAFLALASVIGLEAREVHTVGHVTAEFYDKKRDKWIWIDPSYAFMAKNANGEYLSLTELRDLYFHDQKVVFDLFGKDTSSFDYQDQFQYSYYASKNDFSDIMVTWGNNIFEKGTFNRKWGFIPKAIRQFYGLTTGILPAYLKYEDGNTIKASAQKKKKHIYIPTILLIFGGNIIAACFFATRFLLKLPNIARNLSVRRTDSA